MIHPFTKNVEFTHGADNRGMHRSAGGNNPHYHCNTCGCFLVTDLTDMMTNVFKDESRMSVNVSDQWVDQAYASILTD